MTQPWGSGYRYGTHMALPSLVAVPPMVTAAIAVDSKELQVRISTDNGVTWSAPVIVATVETNEPFKLLNRDGNLLLVNKNLSLLFESRDGGTTWTAL